MGGGEGGVRVGGDWGREERVVGSDREEGRGWKGAGVGLREGSS